MSHLKDDSINTQQSNGDGEIHGVGFKLATRNNVDTSADILVYLAHNPRGGGGC